MVIAFAVTLHGMRKTLVLCLVALVSACSSGGDGGSPSSSTTLVPASTTTVAPIASSTTTIEEIVENPASISVAVSIESAGVDVALEVPIEPTEPDERDPFALFGSCSGLRTSIGNYSVSVADVTADGEVESVAVATVGRVIGPGIHDADVRVEFVGGQPVTAIGTVTLDDGLRSGRFQAFEPAGGLVEGAFECGGADDAEDSPTSIDEVTAPDGVLVSVEVVALLRRDASERVVGLTLDTAAVPDAAAMCPGVRDIDSALIVSVDGGLEIGSISSFRLTPDPAATATMQVGGVSYEFEDVIVTLDQAATSGTFQGATADGVSVDGAFRCV